MPKSKYFEPELLAHFNEVIGGARLKVILEKDDLSALYRQILDKMEEVQAREPDPDVYSESFSDDNSKLLDDLADCRDRVLTVAEEKGLSYKERSKLPKAVKDQVEDLVDELNGRYDSEASILKFLVAENRIKDGHTHLNNIIKAAKQNENSDLAEQAAALKMAFMEQLKEAKRTKTEELKKAHRLEIEEFEAAEKFKNEPGGDGYLYRDRDLGSLSL